ncbi:MAG: eight-cysteine-cluster domain-containing protein [Candidatus Pacearchaeota archaeon]|nr:eight-cysteine-cluster domain-containing protein [Candidatus Pacearchaeota archaeon]
MKGALLFIVICSLFIGLVSAVSITSSAINNQSGNVEDEIQTCLDKCPIGCPSAEYRICASDGQKYCNTCVIECYGLTEVDNSLCEDDETSSNGRLRNAFCGTSTLANCSVDGDCKVGGCSNQVCYSINEEPSVTTCEYRDCYNAQAYSANCRCIKNKCRWNKLTQNQVEKIINATKKIKPSAVPGECPEECTCTGSVMKCQLASGREITIVAGKSGNVIVQVKGIDGSTKVTLYKANGKLYGVFKGNVTRQVKMLPDQVRERIRERIKAKLQNENITLDEDGIYKYEAEKEARLFRIFWVRVPVRAEIDPETGEVIKLEHAWWGFLAKDEADEAVLGASCGTVTPGYNDACCQSKGYDLWNSTSQECEFSPETQSE